jgi:hypothetical protein
MENRIEFFMVWFQLLLSHPERNNVALYSIDDDNQWHLPGDIGPVGYPDVELPHARELWR